MASFVVAKPAQVPFFVRLLTLSPGEGRWEKPRAALSAEENFSRARWLAQLLRATCFTNSTRLGLLRTTEPFSSVATCAKDVFACVSAAGMNCSGSRFHGHTSWTTFTTAGSCEQFQHLGFRVSVRSPGAKRCTRNSLNARLVKGVPGCEWRWKQRKL